MRNDPAPLASATLDLLLFLMTVACRFSGQSLATAAKPQRPLLMRADNSTVIHIVNQMRPGGIETMVIDLVTKSRHPSRIMSLEGTASGLLENWTALASFADRLEAFDRPPRLDLKLVLRIARRFRALRPHTVFVHRTNPLLYGGIAARLAGVPTVVHVEHDVWHYQQPNRRRLVTVAAKLVRPLHFAVSQTIAATLSEMLPHQEVRVVPGGVDLARFGRVCRDEARKALGLPADIRVVGSVGRLEPVKGHKTLIEALPYLPDDMVVVVVGQGSEANGLKDRAATLGVADRVRFLGHRDDVDRLMPAFDVFCLPSFSEGLPRVVMEAQAAGVPIVASDVGSVRQAVDPDTGRLIAPGDPAALADTLRALTLTEAAAASCRRFALDHFSIERMISTYDAMTPLAEGASA